jgi:hypothetical protein
MKNHNKVILIILSIFQTSICNALYEWSTYRPPDIGNGLGYKIVTEIAIDKNNIKYFGHYSIQSRRDGIDFISVYDSEKEKETWRLWSKIHTDRIHSGREIVVDNNNIIWISEFANWIWGYDGSSLFSKTMPFDGAVTAITVDENNNKWIGISNSLWDEYGGLVKYNDTDGSMESFEIGDDIRKLAIDRKNNLWIAKAYELLYYNTDDFIRITLEKEFPEKQVAFSDVIVVDHNNILFVGIWVEEERHGIAQFDGIKWSFYTTQNSGLVSNNVLSIAVDHINVKWFGTDNGVSRFNGKNWTTFQEQPYRLCNNMVNAIAVEKNNTIWFGTDNGVSKYTGEVIPSSVDEDSSQPEAVPVLRAFPNPFNPSTTIEFTLQEDASAAITIYNMAGQKVKDLLDSSLAAGQHHVTWDGTDSAGKAYSAGIYIVRLKAGDVMETGKLVLVK